MIEQKIVSKCPRCGNEVIIDVSSATQCQAVCLTGREGLCSSCAQQHSEIQTSFILQQAKNNEG